MAVTERKFTLLVSDELVRDLDTVKDMDGCSRAATIRKALMDYVASRRRQIQAYRRKQAESEAAA